MRYAKQLLAIVVCLTLVGCAAKTRIDPLKPSKKWTSPDRIEVIKKIDAGPPREIAVDRGRVDVWRLEGPFPEYWGSTPTAASNAAEEAITARSETLPNEQLQCVARELGIFKANRAKLPFHELEIFITQRCGATARPKTYARFLAVDDGSTPVSETDSFKKWARSHADFVTGDDWGAWIGRGEKGVAAVLVTHKPDAKVDRLPIVTGESQIVLGGRLLRNRDSYHSAMSTGPFHSAGCEDADPNRMPIFRVRCSVGDFESVVVDVSFGREEDSYTSTLVTARFWSKEPSPVFRSERAGSTADEPADLRGPLVDRSLDRKNFEEIALRHAFVSRLNKRRTDAGLDPLELDIEQSKQVRALLPLARSDNPALKNEAYSAISAGWLVEAPIIDSTFWSFGFSDGDLEDLMQRLSSHGSNRDLLFEPGRTHIAFGSRLDDDNRRAEIIVATYSRLPDEAHVTRVNRLLGRLKDLRAERGLSPPRKIRELKESANELQAKVTSGELEFHEAASEFVQESLDTNQRWTAWSWSSYRDVESVLFSDRLLTLEPLRVGVMVVPVKRPGAAQYEYLYVITIALTKEAIETEIAQSIFAE